jgi:cbb3-type cytochrome oxidase subunit 3
MPLPLMYFALVRFCYVRWIYKTSALGELGRDARLPLTSPAEWRSDEFD